HLADVVADHRHLAPLADVPGFDEAPPGDAQVLELQVLGHVAEHAEALALVLAGDQVAAAPAPAALVARHHLVDAGDARRQVLGVVLGQAHAAPRLLAGVGLRAALAPDEDGVGGPVGEVAGDGVLEAP